MFQLKPSLKYHGDEHAVFVRFNRAPKLHAASLAIAGAVRNAALCGWTAGTKRPATLGSFENGMS
jgi:hypothetical protein